MVFCVLIKRARVWAKLILMKISKLRLYLLNYQDHYRPPIASSCTRTPCWEVFRITYFMWNTCRWYTIGEYFQSIGFRRIAYWLIWMVKFFSKALKGHLKNAWDDAFGVETGTEANWLNLGWFYDEPSQIFYSQ